LFVRASRGVDATRNTGEHKVMDYIREMQQTDLAWRGGDLKHCFYGLDADLIMLSLVTHEPNFRLLREKMSVRHARGGAAGPRLSFPVRMPRRAPRGAPRRAPGDVHQTREARRRFLDAVPRRAPRTQVRRGKTPKDPLEYGRYDFELLEVGLLREMLQLQFRPAPKVAGPAAPGYELERVVDDFVFLCMLVGNDFLPNMPHLEIVDGSLDLMMSAYRDLLPAMGGHVTQKERIHLPRLEMVARSLAAYEAMYFERRGGLEGVPEYQDAETYADHYYKVKFGIQPGAASSARVAFVRGASARVEGRLCLDSTRVEGRPETLSHIGPATSRRGGESWPTTCWACSGASDITTRACRAGTGTTRTCTRRSRRTWSI